MKINFLRRPILYFCFLSCMLFFIFPSFGQTYDPPLRIELEVGLNRYPYHLRLLGENGLVLFSKSYSKNTSKWTISHYDTNFSVLLTKDVLPDIPLALSALSSDKGNFYVILQSANAYKENVVNTYIVHYNILSRKIDVFSFFFPERATINSIAYFGDIFVFSSYNGKSEESVFLFNKKDMSLKHLYAQKALSLSFQQAYLDTIAGSLWVITKFFESKKQTTFTLTQFNEEGLVVFEKDIIVDENYLLNSCMMSRLDSNHILLTGDYSLNVRENAFVTRNNTVGLFSISLVNNAIENILYSPFETLEGHFSTENRKNTSDLYNNTYLVANHDSIAIVVSDFYTPVYVQETYPDYRGGINYGWNSSPTRISSEAKLVGYKYHIAYFFIYDKSGKLLWYNTFNYNGLLLKSINNLMQAKIEPQTHNTLYYFGFDGKLYSLINNKNEIIQPISIENIDPSSRFLSVNANMISQCKHWYGDCFIYYGYQQLFNRYSGSNSKKGSRYVFYANKLIYQ